MPSRRFQFRLRTLFIVLTITAVLSAAATPWAQDRLDELSGTPPTVVKAMRWLRSHQSKNHEWGSEWHDRANADKPRLAAIATCFAGFIAEPCPKHSLIFMDGIGKTVTSEPSTELRNPSHANPPAN
jgi:hypothetical protein